MKGLIVDFGGVLTTNVFDSFKAFCRAEGLPEDTVKKIFRDREGQGLALLRKLEKGELAADEFSERSSRRTSRPRTYSPSATTRASSARRST